MANKNEEFIKRLEELKEKYHNELCLISEKYDKDLGVAWDMLRAVTRGGDYADGIDIDKDQLAKDFEELDNLYRM